MFNIKLYNNIAECGLSRFGANYNIGADIENPDGILVRSANLLEESFPASLKAIARAGAGVNNIPIDKCTEEGIVVFNTPGANANAVKELAIAALLLSSRKIVEGINWTKTLEGQEDVEKSVEKGKNAFVGPELSGKTLGVIGLGAIGAMLANAAVNLGMNVIGYDPYLSANAAKALDSAVSVVSDLNELYKNSDYISIHVPAVADTKGMLCAKAFEVMKDGIRIINLARATLVCDEDIIAALESGKVSVYVTDFPTAAVIGKKGVISIPHLGASTPESEDNCAVMASLQMKDYLENGNIKNSVNMPAISLPRTFKFRYGVISSNNPDSLCAVNALIPGGGQSVSGTRGNIAYILFEAQNAADENKIASIDGVKRVIAF